MAPSTWWLLSPRSRNASCILLGEIATFLDDASANFPYNLNPLTLPQHVLAASAKDHSTVKKVPFSNLCPIYPQTDLHDLSIFLDDDEEEKKEKSVAS